MASSDWTTLAADLAAAPVSTDTTQTEAGEDIEGSLSTIKRRAPVACKRCRRMRCKCLHDDAQPPCKACLEAGLGANDCIFPIRGQPDDDRHFRHPRLRIAKPNYIESSKPRSGAINPGHNDWEGLPPLIEMIDGVDKFTSCYFQLGFISKRSYLERLGEDHRSTSIFLLLCILSISARITPSIANRYGGGIEAAQFFVRRASILASGEIYECPTLERCQAFYLLSVAQQGNGENNRSYINMNIAIHMAILMRLHREETFQFDSKSPELIMRAESARRTVWMLYCQGNLHASPHTPVSLAVADMSVLLPCDEDDFTSGCQPESRAALEDTAPALGNPELTTGPTRSLFVTILQVNHLWGIIGRNTTLFAESSRPWVPQSEFSSMVIRLSSWERGLLPKHTWHSNFFKRYKSQGQELSYLNVTMMARLCNIALRRPYLVEIIHGGEEYLQNHVYYDELAREIFRNVLELYAQIEKYFCESHPDGGVGTQTVAFCVYTCGLLAAYFCRYPQLCAGGAALSRHGHPMIERTLGLLEECTKVWPLAGRWLESLNIFLYNPLVDYSNHRTESMAIGKEPVPQALDQPTRWPAPSLAIVATNQVDGPNQARSQYRPSPLSPHTLSRGSISNASEASTAEFYTEPRETILTDFAPPPQARQLQYFGTGQQVRGFGQAVPPDWTGRSFTDPSTSSASGTAVVSDSSVNIHETYAPTSAIGYQPAFQENNTVRGSGGQQMPYNMGAGRHGGVPMHVPPDQHLRPDQNGFNQEPPFYFDDSDPSWNLQSGGW